MSTNNFFRSDLFGLYDVIRASFIVYPKEMIISTLRELFSHDSFYHCEIDPFGFINTTDHADLPLGADIPSGVGSNPQLNPDPVFPTRLFIGENYRRDVIFYPAILVKCGGSRYVPISINRNKGQIKYEKTIVVDGYGNETTISKPVAYVTAGVWEGSIIIDIMTRSLRSRDDLAEIVGMCFTELRFETLHGVGIIVKPAVIGAASETDDRNDKLFRQTITLDIRTEWRREVKIESIVDAILFTATFADISHPESPVPANFEINTEVNLVDLLLGM